MTSNESGKRDDQAEVIVIATTTRAALPTYRCPVGIPGIAWGSARFAAPNATLPT